MREYGQVTSSDVNVSNMKDRVLSASEFKRRGRRAALIPAKGASGKSPRNTWARKARVMGDIVDLDTSPLWEVAGTL